MRQTRSGGVKGSQYWIQEYVNNRKPVLNDAIAREAAQLLIAPPFTAGDLCWISPLACKKYSEFRGLGFVGCHGFSVSDVILRDFWPSRGPRWDAVAKISGSEPGLILVEAKAHPGECLSSCRAGTDSRETITERLKRTYWALSKNQLPMPSKWLKGNYQFANRLAHLEFARAHITANTWLVNLYFVDDFGYKSTTEDTWLKKVEQIRCCLGLSNLPAQCINVYLKAS